MSDYEDRKRIIAGTKLASVYDYIDECLKDYTHAAHHQFAAMRDSWEWTIFVTIGEKRYRADAEFPGDTFEDGTGCLTDACELTDGEKLVIVSGLFDSIAWALSK